MQKRVHTDVASLTVTICATKGRKVRRGGSQLLVLIQGQKGQEQHVKQ